MPRKPPASNARKKPRPKLTEKEELFCQYYLVKLNSTEAAIKAGFSPRTAKEKGYQLRHKPHIEARISELYGKRIERVQVDADYVLQRLADIDAMDVADILDDNGELLPIKQWPAGWRKTISGIEVSELWEGQGTERQQTGLLKKIKWPDKLKNLELLGRHTQVAAFKDTIDHNHKGEIRTVTRRVVDPKEAT